MKFKTTIKLITEAKDKNEAMEIAGEYLSGNLATGVDMKLHTVSVRRNRQLLAGAIMVVLAAGVIAIRLHDTQHMRPFIQNLPVPGPWVSIGISTTPRQDKRCFRCKSSANTCILFISFPAAPRFPMWLTI